MDLLPKGIFPSQAVSNAEKASEKYGLEVAKAVESEWFKRDSGTARYYANRDNFHRLRLYARGEQSIQKYKDELSVNGDLSYLNLDWKPVPIIPKFVDIVVNGMTYRQFRRSVEPMFGGDGAVVVKWWTMWLAIEPNGYTHS